LIIINILLPLAQRTGTILVTREKPIGIGSISFHSIVLSLPASKFDSSLLVGLVQGCIYSASCPATLYIVLAEVQEGKAASWKTTILGNIVIKLT
jgi:hypothetical protein